MLGRSSLIRWRMLSVFLGLNLIWEVTQLPFYTLWKQGSWQEISYAVVHCTIGDGIIGIAITLISIAAFRVSAVSRTPGRALAVFVMLGMSYTLFSEWLNVHVRGTWAYSDLMPLVLPLGTGLTPLLQWIIVPLLTWLLVGEPITSKRSGRSMTMEE